MPVDSDLAVLVLQVSRAVRPNGGWKKLRLNSSNASTCWSRACSRQSGSSRRWCPEKKLEAFSRVNPIKIFTNMCSHCRLVIRPILEKTCHGHKHDDSCLFYHGIFVQTISFDHRSIHSSLNILPVFIDNQGC